MTTADLKTYTARAAELEAAVYTQRKLMGDHKTLLHNQRPTTPKRENIPAPQKPVKPEPVDFGGSNVISIIIAIPVLIGCIAFISALPFLGIIILLACIYGFYSMLSGQAREKDNAQKAQQKYLNDMLEYNHQMEQYQRNYKNASDDYINKLQSYNTHIYEYNKSSSAIVNKHEEVLASIEAALQEHYAQDIIFPKYRNMVAITTINEYLMSGRCYELEGPNGAYNLYEMELRQNIIINQLSSIISNLEQIRNNQFSLYQELVKANSTVKEILHDVQAIQENTRLTAYFAGVTALIEASPKVYIGHSF